MTNKTQLLPSWKLHSNEYTCHLGFSIHNTYLYNIFNKLLLNTYYEPGIVPNAEDRVVNKTNKNPYILGTCI